MSAPSTTGTGTGLDLCLRVLSAYGGLDGVVVSPMPGGLINETYLVETSPGHAQAYGPRAVLQRLSPIFGPAVHEDIEAITAHLQARGMTTPRLHRTCEGRLCVELGEQGIWRLMTFIPGQSHHVMTPALAYPAGHLVGCFHEALRDLPHKFHFSRPGAHDLAGHLQRLRQALAASSRPEFTPPETAVPAEFFELGGALIKYADETTWPTAEKLPLRLCHGDLKTSNLRFDERGQGVCLLDLDTLAYLPLAFELGDALRSWCNPKGEDVPSVRFDLEIFEQALLGYAGPARAFLTPEEQSSLVAGALRITFQLAVRFAVDVVEQRYFRWNSQRFQSRAAHNLLRASGQWSLCRDLAAVRPRAEKIVERLFASASARAPESRTEAGG